MGEKTPGTNVPGVLVSFEFRQMPWGSGERRPALNAGQLRKGVANRGLGDCGVVPCAGRDVGKVRRCLRIGLHERQVAAAAKHAVEDSHRLSARDGLVRVERAIRIAAAPAVGIGRSGCAGLRLRGVCSESRDSSETECQHQGQYQAQCLAHFFMEFCLL